MKHFLQMKIKQKSITQEVGDFLNYQIEDNVGTQVAEMAEGKKMTEKEKDKNTTIRERCHREVLV